MKFLPSEISFKILTHFSKERVLEILRENVADRNPLNPILPDTLFRGGVYHSEFEAKEVVGYTYALLPVFRGKLQKSENGTVLRVKASNVLTTFLGLWAWICSIMIFCVGIMALQHGNDSYAGTALMFGGVFSTAIVLFNTRFYFRKVEDGRKLLCSLFDAKNS